MERKEAIEVIKKNWPDSNFTMLREALETLIPELKESEDERIRKELVQFFKEKDEEDFEEWIPKAKVLSWFEKQDEQKLPIEKLPSETKTIGESLGFTTQEECDKYNQMVTDLIMSDDKGELKSAETVEWSPQEENCICQLESLVKEQWRQVERVHNSVKIKKMAELIFFLKTLNPNKKPQKQ